MKKDVYKVANMDEDDHTHIVSALVIGLIILSPLGVGLVIKGLERRIAEEAEKAGITIPLGEKRKLGNSNVIYCGRAIPQKENFYLSIDGDRVDYPANSKRIKAGGREYDVVLNPDSVYLKPVVRAEKEP